MKSANIEGELSSYNDTMKPQTHNSKNISNADIMNQITHLTSHVDERFNQLSQAIAESRAEHDVMLSTMNSFADYVKDRFNQMENRFDRLEARVDQHDVKFAHMPTTWSPNSF